jgi:hypothetical protein
MRFLPPRNNYTAKVSKTALFSGCALWVIPIVAACPPASAQQACSGTNPISCRLPVGSSQANLYVPANGANGTDGVVGTFWWEEDTTPTSGQPGRGIVADIAGRLGGGGGIPLDLLSQGGKGGNGDAPSLFGTVFDAQAAGAGGSLLLTIRGTSTINETDDFLPAINVQSLGGQGGIGPAVNNLMDRRSSTPGGDGGSVTIEVEDAAVIGAKGDGITAVSAGGDGGVVGDGNAQGSNGGNGGRGGPVEIDIGGRITTSGESGDGVVAKSLGGDGGGVVLPTANENQGNGGRGGDGGASTINILSTGVIDVQGAVADAVWARSQGGTGGNITYEGRGGDGGNGGTISVTNDGELTTTSATSNGIRAESIGGNAGGSGIAAGIGRNAPEGGNGGTGGQVTVANNGTITTENVLSRGIFAQSTGGYGGDGGTAVGLFGTGGQAGTTGAGGPVTITNTGTITTLGKLSDGIEALSIGGGGGEGTQITDISSQVPVGGAAKGLGGTSGDGSDASPGGAITLTNGGAIETNGADSNGIVGLSVGGGGGDAGEVQSGGLFASWAVGGGGGAGGDGGTLSLTNTGAIATLGDNSSGILLTSVGGDGGVGGEVYSYCVGYGGCASVAIGGTGGKGGSGGQINPVTNWGTITTAGANADGVELISVGGGGGKGGDSLSVSLSGGKVASFSAAIAVGGTGGSGGNGGDITFTNEGQIITSGEGAAGVRAITVGGGGGDGGDATATAVAIAAGKSATITVGVGGSTGVSGDGGTISVTNNDSVTTTGKSSDGINAVSVGGGGGEADVGDLILDNNNQPTAGTATTNSFAISNWFGQGQAAQAALSIGGDGGGGGGGGSVTVINTGTIETSLDESRGIFAESVGGGGGNAGGGTANGLAINFSGSVGIGGNGGVSGNGGTVTVNNQGSITTAGVEAPGILAMSVGGGGGAGGSAIGNSAGSANTIGTATGYAKSAAGLVKAAFAKLYDFIQTLAQTGESSPSGTSSKTVSVSLAIGGQGGAGGDGGVVQVNNLGTIVTAGDEASGIIAQSVGGGGGSGGEATSRGSGDVALSVTLGGGGGSAGDGGDVSVRNTRGAAIATSGDDADGIFAESVGGGGGSGEAANNSNGLLSYLALGWNQGGDNGNSGNGGTVTVNNDGSIKTTGTLSYGIFAQSVGGGGGTIEEINNNNAVSNSYVSLGIVNIGGNAGSQGNGGPITINNTGTVQTSGADSFGIFAQSVGGGGGYAGLSVNDTWFYMPLTFSGDRSVRGAGGTITINNSGSIVTSGTGASGVVAESVGGGGGYMDVEPIQAPFSLPSTTYALVGNGDYNGDGGKIAVVNTGTIATTGTAAHGIWAISIGGGGIITDTNIMGLGGTAGTTGNGGAITINAGGTITTLGADSDGIWAENAGETRDPISITVSGTVTGGSGAGAGLRIDGGNFENAITITSTGIVSALSGTAIAAAGGSVTNNGVVQGNIDLSLGANLNNFYWYGGASGLSVEASSNAPVFTNAPSGVVVTGNSVDLTDLGQFINAGVLRINGLTTTGTTSLTGSFSQTASGSLLPNIDPLGEAGSLLAVSKTAALNGKVEPYLVQSIGLTSSPIPVLSASSITGTVAPVNSVAVTYATEIRNNHVLVSATDVNFRPSSLALGQNEADLAGYFQSLYNAGNGVTPGSIGQDEFADMLSLANSHDPNAYAKELESLVDAGRGELAADAVAKAGNFQSNMRSCPTYVGTTATLREEDCIWSRAIGGVFNQGNTADAPGFREATGTFQIGGQQQFAQDWFVGLSAAYELGEARSYDGNSKSSSQGSEVGGVVKRQWGEWLFSTGLSYGFEREKEQRLVTDGSAVLVGKNFTDSHEFELSQRSSYTFDFGQWYLKPMVDLSALYIYQPGSTETGAGDLSLKFNSSHDWALGITPAAEIGTRIDVAGGAVRPFVSLGTAVTSRTQWSTESSFVGAPAGTGTETEVSNTPRFQGVGSLGIDFVQPGGLNLRAEYNTRFSENTTYHAGVLRVGYQF